MSFDKTGDLNGSSYVKLPLTSTALINIKKIDKYCFIWSFLASIHPCENDHLNKISNYSEIFNDLGVVAFDFTKRFKCSDMERFEKVNKISINKDELNFCQDGDKCKNNLIPIEISKIESDKVFDFLIFEKF